MEKIQFFVLWVLTFLSVFTHANEGSKPAAPSGTIPKGKQEIVVPTPQPSWCEKVVIICEKQMSSVVVIHGAKIEGIDSSNITTMYCINQGVKIVVSTKDGKKVLDIPEKDLRKCIAENNALAPEGDYLVMNEIKPFKLGNVRADGF